MIRHQIIIPLLGLAVVLALVLFLIPEEEYSRESCPLYLSYEPVDEFPLPDFSIEKNIYRRKVLFFEYMLPMVQMENLRLADIRQRLVYIQEHIRLERELDTEDQTWFETALVEFRMADRDISEPRFWTMLFLRADQLPDDLVLIQAANESAWGTSRFASEGNNLFGQWCFSPGCGMVPEGRLPGDTHEVAIFDSVPHSVAAYMRNLNSGHAYDKLREIRANLRAKGKPVTAASLATGLIRYSQRGEDYVSELLAMLRVNAPIIDEIRSAGANKPEA